MARAGRNQPRADMAGEEKGCENPRYINCLYLADENQPF